MQLSLYSETDATAWDDLVGRAPMATFLHTRRFLAYHRHQFQDLSLVLRDDRQHVTGLFPAAVDPAGPRRVVSHPGITFGGLLHADELHGERMLEALTAVRDFYAAQGFESLRYKAVPYIYQQAPSGDDLYALFRLGALRARCDLSCAIDLAHRRTASSRRKRGLKKALKQGVEVASGAEFIDRLWPVIEDNLERKLGGKPVHTAAEIKYLHELFPANIKFVVGLFAGELVAGITLFVSPAVARAQYIASSMVGYDVCALDAIFEHAIAAAQADGRRYFDFGTSNQNEGRDLSASLYQFKAEFGGGGVVHEFYDLDLTSMSNR